MGTTPKIIVACHTFKHGLAIADDWWLTIPIPRDNKLCRFCSYNAVEMSDTLCYSIPSITPFREVSISIQNAIPGNLKSFFQLDCEVDISRNLHYLRELTFLTSSSCTSSPKYLWLPGL